MNYQDTDLPVSSEEEIQLRAFEIILHDAKNLITNINAASELLLQADLKEAERKRLIKIINSAGREVELLVKGQETVMQIEKGTYHPTFKRQKLLNRIRYLIEEQKNLIEQKKLSAHVVGEKKDFWIETDWFCFDAVLRNIIRNAIQASPRGSTVTIHTGLMDRQLQVSVHNKGMIPEEVRHHFFKKYISVRSRKEGLGLGTYIAKKMIDVLGGEISFASTKKEGTTVFLKLPVLL